ncbi:hypothetical protein QQ008_29445 [Fulvivirgaceae bacterium BMA10]|uniref:Outer membrane protein beta-barrel domain-containing protein n=1 Tax=Splendidivirga corallicola TaxID=3051826 RepID=A0ABT8L1Q6_9BACT|nr:hypothetical protein [Fulvivirgaceae bacterium BMA10]
MIFQIIKQLFAACSLSILFMIVTPARTTAQEVGVSASFFFPKNGYFSIPVSPISFRDVGVNFNDFLGVETGITLYRISGLSVKDLPFDSEKPLVGPMFTVLVPLNAVLEFGFNGQRIKFRAGSFFFYNFDQKVNHGNLDRELKKFTGLEVVNAEFTSKPNIGFGYYGGIEYVIYLSNSLGLTFGGNYFIGDSKAELGGTYVGSDTAGTIITEEVSYPDSKVDFTGLELSVGILIGG